MSHSETTVSPASGGSARPSTRRASSSAYFYGRLKAISGDTSEAEQSPQHEVVTVDGKSVTITHSAQRHTIPPESSVAIPSNSGLGLVATLFYVGPRGGGGGSSSAIEQDTEDRNFGAYVSDMAILEFIQTIEGLMVPYKKISAHHSALDSSEQPKIVAIAFAMPEMLDLTDLRRHEELWGFERKWNVEVVLQQNDVFRKYKRLAVFDMDSTLIQQEVIDEIAKYVGFEAEVSKITERAMNGQIDFTESLRLRCRLLKGVPAEVWEELKGVITLTPGAKELCTALKALGYKLAVLSGGFQPLADYIKEQLGLDYAFANNLVVSEDGNELTGDLTGDIVNAERKEHLLEMIAKENGIPLQQTLAVGDGANDLKMMHKAGLGIAFNAKPTVQLEAPCRINSKTLRDVLYVLGLSKEEQGQLC